MAQPDRARWQALADEVDRVAIDYALLKAESPASWGTDDDRWLHLARQVLRMGQATELDDPEIVPIAMTTPGKEALTLRCLDPSPWLGPQIELLGGFVGLSATLQPHAFHRDLLGLDPEKLDVVSVESSFPAENRKVIVVPRVSTAFRDREEQHPIIARLMARCIAEVPGNVACYFSSFAVLQDIIGRWEGLGRPILVQEPGMSTEAREALLAPLSGSEPVVLAAVLGGIYAEGIDLPPGALSAVFICGPGLPPIGLEQDLLTELYEDKYGQGYAYASWIPGLTRVTQAAGRLIRRPEDRGVVVLFGRRFRFRDVNALLPTSFAPEIPDDPVVAVRDFFA